jgi:hypothetical protein
MALFPLAVACPRCGSRNITYTCEPKCCFNHLCGDCYGTFELRTSLRPGGPLAVEAPGVERDSLAPAAPCAGCQGIGTYLVDSGEPPNDRAVCVDCRSLLTVEWVLT